MEDSNPVVKASQLMSSIGSTNLRIVDCRFELLQPDAGRDSYLHNHIPGAVYADLDRDLAAPVESGTGRHPLPDPVALANTFGRLGITNSTNVVVYDDCSGALAARAWWLLRWLGHDRAAVLEGGFALWQSLQLPIESGENRVAEQLFIPTPRPELVLETPDLERASNDSLGTRLVDARDAARFRGEVEPIDCVAGHVPGAMNLPYAQSLNSDGTWRSKEELVALWEAALGDECGKSWGVMCGSGVTACHLVISALLAGLAEPRVYVGSWSEWISDPDREVATGAG